MTDQILPIPPMPDGLREAAQRGILIPFVGAGTSRLAGCPGWADFADGALMFFIERGMFTHAQLAQIRHLSHRVKLSLARALEVQHNIRIDFRALIHPSGVDNAKGRRLYDSLFRLGKIFVTTNYDEWLDKTIPGADLRSVSASQEAGAPSPGSMRVICRIEDLSPTLLSQPNTVIHLHGSVMDPRGMILTTQDYVRCYANDRSAEPSRENRVLTFLEHLFKHKTVLFIGYGLEELEILEYVILKARRPGGARDTEARHYLIQGFYSHEEQVLRTLKSYYLKECGIQLIPFLRDYKDREQLLDVLDEFARLAPASEPMMLQKAHEMEDLLNG